MATPEAIADEPTVRWGIISTADIGMKKVTPAIQGASNSFVAAIASRDAASAADAAKQLGIPKAYDTYEALLADETIDAVYIPLPNDLHAEWTIRAADAGKHILCEKPLAMSSMQAQEMVDACADAGVLLQEAFMYRHHPSWVKAIRLVRSGAIGTVQGVTAAFSYYNDDPSNIRNRTESGGGAVMDIGCYPINVARLVFESEPDSVASVVSRDPQMGIDIVTSAVLGFPGGGQASFTCSTRAEDYQRVQILGTDGRIEVEIPFNIPPDRETRIQVTSGGEPPTNPDTESIVFPPADQYTVQAELFAAAVLSGGPVPVPPADAVANMKVIEAVLAS